jgi:ribonucleoside-diphosphate reductase alpha chain
LAGEWMWNNRDFYNGLSVLPYNGGSYIQAPFEDCTKEEYERLFSKLQSIDLSKVIELQDDTSLSDSVACGGGACEIV